jgi:hypothetical protein
MRVHTGNEVFCALINSLDDVCRELEGPPLRYRYRQGLTHGKSMAMLFMMILIIHIAFGAMTGAHHISSQIWLGRPTALHCTALLLSPVMR